MFIDRGQKAIFFSAPPSVASLGAAFLEPTLTVLVYLSTLAAFGKPALDSDLMLCLLAFILTFPGRNRCQDNLSTAAVGIVLSWIELLVILWLCAYATGGLHDIDRDVVLTWILLTPPVHWLSVASWRTVRRRLAARPGLRQSAVVIGAGLPGIQMARAIKLHQDDGHFFAGWFDDRSGERVHAEASTHLLGTLDDAAPYILANSIKEVYITLPLDSRPRTRKLLESVQGTTASIYLVPDVFGIDIIQGRLHDMKGVPVVGICESPFTRVNQLAKRTFDVLLSSIVLLLAAPLLLAVAVGVKLSFDGPTLLKQRREGMDGDEFTVYTFRSASAQGRGPGAGLATTDGLRMTSFGALLRRQSLDKLPQFFNVLRGQMSIVGPRPRAAAHRESHHALIRGHMVRHKVKPGITGWAQINCPTDDSEVPATMKASVELDLEYLRHWSLKLDLQIIFRAMRIAIFGPNANSFVAPNNKLHRLQD